MTQVPVDFADEKEHRRKLAEAINALVTAIADLKARVAALEAP